ncbi:MAG: hypothetical protein JXX29_05640 [Deltaproteobacteria bacterium]|nr:hypothetical protein [Deltaproteobacteria bacterium]MBN2671131.1 hypothetical protein [Deltaproteobacteria bacterium]
MYTNEHVAAFRETPLHREMPLHRETRTSLLLTILLSFVFSACYGSTMPDAGPRGTVRFKSNAPDAILEINETRLGPIGMFEETGVLLKPGEHRVVVYQDGFFKEYRLITVVQDELQIVEFSLTPIPR